MEINVALDELLGLRGPISSLLRNLLWLLVFNAVYLGFFAFIPRTIGSVVFSNMLNTTVFHSAVDRIPAIHAGSDEDLLSLKTAISQVNEESNNLNTVFRLPDFASVNLGYLFCAALIIMLRLGWILILRCRGTANNDDDNAHNEERQPVPGANPAIQGGMNHQADRVAGDHEGNHRHADGFEHPGFAIGEAVTLILDAAVSIVKVGILLFLKMFLLPVLLGVWLDGSSMELFGSNAQDRILYAGQDLFSFILLHWVAGITFMLLVTVSGKQLPL
jgi:E3 ubiquitin-protein ligase MARCH6